MKQLARALLCVLFAALVLVAQPRAAAKRPITETDLYKFAWIADPQISPDAKTVAFVQVTVNEKDNKYESSLYTVPVAGGAAPVRMTGGTRDTTPRWSPDGQWLAFVRPSEKEVPQIHLLPLRGGEARVLTDVPRGATAPVWSPDGRTIAFTSTTVADDLKKPDPAKSDPKATPDRKSDVKVVTRAVYRANFADGRDIAETAVIADLLAEIGAEPAEALARAGSPETKERLRQETEAALAAGLFGAPSFRAGGDLFWGNDRLEAALDRAAAK